MFNDPLRHLAALPVTKTGSTSPRDAVPSSRDPDVIEDRLDRLALICMAMWSLIQSETNLTEDDLLERVKDIDLMDGAGDGKITRQVTQCSRCRRPMSTRHTRCIYCGSDQLVASAFDTV